MNWLTLLTTLPPTPTRHRVGVWRKLQRMGAVRLRGSAWLLPETPETTERFQWLLQEIESFRGEATLLHVERVGNMTEEQVKALFDKAPHRRVPGRHAGLPGDPVVSSIARKANHRGAIAKFRGKLDGLKRELDRIQAIDYLETPAGAAHPDALGDYGPAPSLGGVGPSRHERPSPDGPAAPGQHLGDAAAPAHRPDRIGLAHQALLRSRRHVRLRGRRRRRPQGHPVRCAGRRLRTPRRGLHVRDAGEAVRGQGPAREGHRRDRARGGPARRQVHPRRITGVDLAISGLAATIADDHELLERGMSIFDGLHAVLKKKT